MDNHIFSHTTIVFFTAIIGVIIVLVILKRKYFKQTINVSQALANSEMIAQLVRAGHIKHVEVAEAFQAINRIHFVSEKHKNRAYEDTALPIGDLEAGATISSPHIHASVLQAALSSAQDPDLVHILDVGSGSGIMSCLLTAIYPTSIIHAVEHLPSLVEQASSTIKKHYSHLESRITFTTGDAIAYAEQEDSPQFYLIHVGCDLTEDAFNRLRACLSPSDQSRVIAPVCGRYLSAGRSGEPTVVLEHVRMVGLATGDTVGMSNPASEGCVSLHTTDSSSVIAHVYSQDKPNFKWTTVDDM
eukprot:gnl/Dysnectes_brevis/6478_a10076_527.p1 GENE.gnl/Dysnectes_brevis/6478_a10076_527~~gnl/Dysnectes_brevis/6478_a10076_527.p1  ORF type:complete len:301 (+),score=23.63 gnl/Dysnectes_brevis/6478_a10076_527:3-905(+)